MEFGARLASAKSTKKTTARHSTSLRCFPEGLERPPWRNDENSLKLNNAELCNIETQSVIMMSALMNFLFCNIHRWSSHRVALPDRKSYEVVFLHLNQGTIRIRAIGLTAMNAK